MSFPRKTALESIFLKLLAVDKSLNENSNQFIVVPRMPVYNPLLEQLWLRSESDSTQPVGSKGSWIQYLDDLVLPNCYRRKLLLCCWEFFLHWAKHHLWRAIWTPVRKARLLGIPVCATGAPDSWPQSRSCLGENQD